MSDKTRRLENFKREGKEQERRSEQMKEEVQRHKKEVDTLEQAVESLKQGQTELQTDAGSDAIRSLDRAKDAAKTEMDRIKVERDRLLSENKKMTESVKKTQMINRTVGKQLDLILNMAQGEVDRELTEVTKSLSREWNDLAVTESFLSSAQLKLKQIRID